jgi:hypothetical protein
LLRGVSICRTNLVSIHIEVFCCLGYTFFQAIKPGDSSDFYDNCDFVWFIFCR